MKSVSTTDGSDLPTAALRAPIDPVAPPPKSTGATIGLLLLAGGALSLLIPTLIGVAKVSWSTDEGAHGPIVLAIAVWLVMRSWPAMMRRRQPGNAALGGIALAGLLFLYVGAHIVGSITIESFALYLALVVTLYLMVGHRAMASEWFPIFFALFVLPPPGRIVAAATQPLRLGLSEVAVQLLAKLDYPVARSGLTIFVGQYELLVKAACAGLNSMISLSAICLFYIYAKHNANWRYCGLMLFAIIPMAILANLIRILLLIMITYYLGNRAAEGFLHETAGMVMFVIALGGIMLIDRLASPLRTYLARKEVAA